MGKKKSVENWFDKEKSCLQTVENILLDVTFYGNLQSFRISTFTKTQRQ